MEVSRCGFVNSDFKVFYTQKYAFSEPTLNTAAVAKALFSGRDDLIGLLEHHAHLGESQAQKTLHSVYKADLTHPEKATEWLEIGLKQEKLWALKEKIQLLVKSGKGKTFGICDYHIKAAHQKDLDSQEALKSLLGDKILYSRTMIKNPRELLNKEFPIEQYLNKGFGSNIWNSEKKPWTSYGSPLTKIGLDCIALHKGTAKKNNYLWMARQYFLKGAELGCKESMAWLGAVYGMESNLSEALKWHKKAAALIERGGLLDDLLKSAHLNAGLMELQNFDGHALNEKEALFHFSAAAEMGCLDSMLQAARFDKENACALWESAAKLGSAEAMYFLGEQEEPKNLEKALFWYKQAALLGHMMAALKASYLFYTLSNVKESLKWAEIAVKNGSKDALVQCGFKETILGNDKKALHWHTLAAKEGFIASMNAAGGLEKQFNNLKQSTYWFERAAEHNHPEALCALAFMHMKQNPSKALSLFERAAKKGHLMGIYNAGGMEFTEFKGHPSNPQKALVWYLKASELGNAAAMWNVAHIYMGLGEYGKALFWLHTSSDAGCPEAKNFIENICAHQSKTDEELVEIHEIEVVVQLPEEKKVDLGNQNLFLNVKDIKKEDDWEEELSIELAEYPDFKNYQPEVNVKNVRSQFEQLEKINNALITFTISLDNLSNKNKLIWESLNDFQSTVTVSELIHFANDEAFGGQFFYNPTASGIIFCFSHQNKHGTVSMHAKHNKSYKGVDKSFAKDFCQMVRDVLATEKTDRVK